MTRSRAPGTPTSSVLETVAVLLHQKQRQLWVCNSIVFIVIKISNLIVFQNNHVWYYQLYYDSNQTFLLCVFPS